LSADPSPAGERGGDLLDGLQAVQRANGRQRRTAAAELIDDVSSWQDDGELDPAWASAALVVLDPLAR
jgi:hypothetical protein